MSISSGGVAGSYKSSDYDRYVWPVRGGQSGSSDHLAILWPGQGTSWEVGVVETIGWQTAGLTENVRISLSRDGELGTFESKTDSTDNDGSFEWTVTGPESADCVLRIEPVNDPSKGDIVGPFTIVQPNWAPVANDDTFSVNKNSTDNSLAMLENDTDPDILVPGDTLSIISVGTPDRGGLTVIDGDRIRYSPAANFYGTENFFYTISDSHGASSSATVSVAVVDTEISIEELAVELMAFFNQAVEDKTLKGKGADRKIRTIRLRHMRALVEKAVDLIQGGFPDIAHAILQDAYMRCDGQRPLADWVKGPSKAQFASMMQQLISRLASNPS